MVFLFPVDTRRIPDRFLLVSPDRSRLLMDLSVGWFLFRDLVVADSIDSRRLSRSPVEEAADSLEDDLDLTPSFWAGTFRPLAPGFCSPELGLARLREGRGSVLVFLGVARPAEESRERFFLTPGLLTEVVLGLALGGGTPLSPLFCRDRDSLVDLGLFLFRGRVP